MAFVHQIFAFIPAPEGYAYQVDFSVIARHVGAAFLFGAAMMISSMWRTR